MRIAFAPLIALLVVGAGSPRVHGQAAAPATFDVASIRLNTSDAAGGGGGPRPGGRYIYTNMPVRSLIAIAYGLPNDRLIGAPAWLATTRYDINATGKENPVRAETEQMFRALLRDRFRLAVHPEKRELPVYSLVVARPDGRLGPGLRRSAIDCNDPEARKKAAAAAVPGARMTCGIMFGSGQITAGGTEVSVLLGTLTSASGRAVLDRTGLTGGYDIDLKWTVSPQPDADAVSIFTAVQEQLGLKLENATAQLDVLVIDRIERPTEN